MSEEEEDFMSDKFLASLESTSKPSKSSQSYAEKRRKAINKSQDRGLTISRKEREAAARTEGLSRNLIIEARMNEVAQPVYSTPVASTSKVEVAADSKALDMMRKMGFKPGQALGKRKSLSPSLDDAPPKSKARTEPIAVQMRTGRGGLGTEEQTRKFRLDPDAVLPERISQDAYLATVRESFDDRRAEGVLRGARRTCEELDRRIGMVKSVMWLDPFEVEKEMRKKLQARRLGEYVSDDEDEVEFDDLKKVKASLEDEVVEEDGSPTTREEWLAMDVCPALSHRYRLADPYGRLEPDWRKLYSICETSISKHIFLLRDS